MMPNNLPPPTRKKKNPNPILDSLLNLPSAMPMPPAAGNSPPPVSAPGTPDLTAEISAVTDAATAISGNTDPAGLDAALAALDAAVSALKQKAQQGKPPAGATPGTPAGVPASVAPTAGLGG